MPLFQAYLRSLSHVNGLDSTGRIDWLFYNGMLFGSHAKWWGDWQIRSTCHEGIDICWYRAVEDKSIRCFDPETKVPAMDDGVVVNICRDFLASTLVVEQSRDEYRRQVFAYAHIIPEGHIEKGFRVEANDTIATVCDTRKNPQLPPHLHFSCFEIPVDIPPEFMDWNLFTDPEKVNMVHPVFL